MTATRYVYSTVRVVPNPATGEFANLAAIAGSDVTGEWALRGLSDESRVVRFCGAGALTAAHDFLSRTAERFAWHEMIQDAVGDLGNLAFDTDVSEAWLAQTASANKETVQLSPPRPVLASSVEDVFDLIYSIVLVEPEKRPSRNMTKWRAISDLNSRYASNGLGGYVERRRVLIANGFEYPVDFAVSDFRRAVQLSQTWSFQVGDMSPLRRDIKAWGWTLRELRDRGGAGGSVRLANRLVTIASDVPAHAVVIPPAAGEQQAEDAFGEASLLFRELGVSVHELGSDLASITDEARTLLHVDIPAGT